MTDIMVDLETLSVRNNAIILTIGAIKFDRNKILPKSISDIPEEKMFYKRIKISSCEKIGLHRDSETENWWKKQHPDAYKEAFGFETDRIDIKNALKDFSKWFGFSTYIWGNGSIFDITILSEAYLRCNLPVPWKFYNVRDLRTILDVCDIRHEDNNTNKHNALYDCFFQIKDIQKCFI
jgi:hypothetical protein